MVAMVRSRVAGRIGVSLAAIFVCGLLLFSSLPLGAPAEQWETDLATWYYAAYKSGFPLGSGMTMSLVGEVLAAHWRRSVSEEEAKGWLFARSNLADKTQAFADGRVYVPDFYDGVKEYRTVMLIVYHDYIPYSSMERIMNKTGNIKMNFAVIGSYLDDLQQWEKDLIAWYCDQQKSSFPLGYDQTIFHIGEVLSEYWSRPVTGEEAKQWLLNHQFYQFYLKYGSRIEILDHTMDHLELDEKQTDLAYTRWTWLEHDRKFYSLTGKHVYGVLGPYFADPPESVAKDFPELVYSIGYISDGQSHHAGYIYPTVLWYGRYARFSAFTISFDEGNVDEWKRQFATQYEQARPIVTMAHPHIVVEKESMIIEFLNWVASNYPDVWIGAGKEVGEYCKNRLALQNLVYSRKPGYHEVAFNTLYSTSVLFRLTEGRYVSFMVDGTVYSGEREVSVKLNSGSHRVLALTY